MKKSKTLLTVVLITVITGAVAMTAVFLGSPERLYSSLEKGKRPRGARERLQKVLMENPNDLRAQSWLLNIEIDDGDMAAAQSRLSMLEIKAPDHYNTLSGACYYNLESGHKGKRVEVACRGALNLSDRRPVKDLNRFGAALLLNKKPDEALPILLEAREKAPRDHKVLNNLGYCHLQKDEPEKAIGFLKEAVELQPGFVSARRSLSRAYYESGNYQAAADELKALLVFAPDDIQILVRLAMIYGIYLKDLTEAEKYVLEAIALGLEMEAAQDLSKIIIDANNPPPQPPDKTFIP